MTRSAHWPLLFGSLLWAAVGCVGGQTEDTPGASGAGGSGHSGGSSGSVAAHAGAAGSGLGAAGSPSAGAPTTGGSPGMAGAPTQAGAPSTGGGGTGAAGAAPVAGAPGMAGMGAGGGSVVSPQFKLLWRDEFDSFDGNRWKKATHDFAENAAQFVQENAVVEGGLLKLRITKVAKNGHPYSAAEVYTNDQYTFGRFEARIKFAAGSGIVSSIFTYRDNINAGWNEIDIENLGYITDGVQFNLISSASGPANTYQPHVVKTGFKPVDDFHDYAIEWVPSEIRFFVDGKQVWKDVQSRIVNASRLRMNCWPTNNANTSFAGPLDASKIPAEAQYDWAAVYSYNP